MTTRHSLVDRAAISVIIFVLVVNMLVKSAEAEVRVQRTPHRVWGPTTSPPPFMDDLTATTASVPGTGWIPKGLEEPFTWARMSFKPVKSRSLLLKKYHLTVGGTQTPSISEQPATSPGEDVRLQSEGHGVQSEPPTKSVVGGCGQGRPSGEVQSLDVNGKTVNGLQLYNAFPVTYGHPKCFTILPHIHPFIHTFTHRRRCRPCTAPASSSGAG